MSRLASATAGFLGDLRHAVRTLERSPLLTLVVVVSLALGIGANTTMFSLVNALLLRPAPANHPERLASVFTSESDGRRYGASSYPDYLDYRDRNPAFESLAAFSPSPMSLTVAGKSQRLLGTIVSGNYFSMMEVRPALGRTLLPDDDLPGAPPVVMVSHGLWTRRFGSDPALVGRPLSINGHPFQVVGVLPSSFRGAVMGITPDLFVPFSTVALAHPGSDRLDHRGNRGLLLTGRLKSGRTPADAQREMNGVRMALAREYPTDSARVATVLPESESRIFPSIRGAVVAFTALLVSVVGLVLLVACANVAGLMLARGAARRREIGVRLALGASRGRIVRQLLCESLLLGLLGGAAGLGLAYWGTDLLLAFKPPVPIDITLDLRPDLAVMVFTLVLSLATGVVFGLLPALEATRVDLLPAINETPTGTRRGSRLRSSLVVAQVAVTLLLLLGAGLMLRGLSRAARLDPGFDVDHTVAVSFDLRLRGYDDARGKAFERELLERVAALPRVRGAALDEHLPLGFGGQSSGIAIEGHTPGPREILEIGSDVVSAGYFATLGLPIVMGRDFGPQDHEGARGVAIVNQTFARRFWPGSDPIGRRLSLDTSGGGGWLEVVGVAKDSKYRTLGEDPRPFFYLPLSQVYGPEMTLVVRADGDPRTMLASVRRAALSLDPGLPLFDEKTMFEHLGITLFPSRLASTVLGVFGLMAMILAAVGLYGVVAFAVGQRTREIGVRVALGASPRDVQGLIVGQGLKLAVIGIAIGLAAAAVTMRLTASLLFGLSPTDPATFAGISLLLLSATLFASWLPARRAARVDPMSALKHE